MNHAAVAGRSASALDIRPIAGALGAEIHGIDLSRPARRDVVRSIRQALLDSLVIFFRHKALSPARLKAFAEQFGRLSRYPFVKGLPNHPEVIEVKKLEHERVNFGGIWQSATTYLDGPPIGSMLSRSKSRRRSAIRCSPACWRDASDGMKRMLAGLRGINSSAKTDVTRTQEDRIAEKPGQEKRTVCEAVHPVVRTHPESGRKALYVNTAHLSGSIA